MTKIKLILTITSVMLFSTGLNAQVFIEDFDSGIGAWTPGVERNDHRRDAPNPPAYASGGAVLSSKSSCFSSPYNGVATTLTRTIALPPGAYSLSHLVSHSTELHGYCRGGTGGSSSVSVNGLLVTRVGCGRSRSCGVCRVPLSEQSGCFSVDETGEATIVLRTSGGDCAKVVGFFDNLVIFPADDCDGDGISNECDPDDDNDGVPDEVDACPCSNLSPTVVIDGCDSGVTNVLNENGCTISDLLSEIGSSAKNHGQYVSKVSALLNVLKDAGIISGKDKGKIQSCAAKSSIGK
jgi:hypothetical protein